MSIVQVSNLAMYGVYLEEEDKEYLVEVDEDYNMKTEDFQVFTIGGKDVNGPTEEKVLAYFEKNRRKRISKGDRG